MKRNDAHKFKKPTNNLKHLLGDNILDDETRRQLMIDIQEHRVPVIAPPPAGVGAAPTGNPRGSMPQIAHGAVASGGPPHTAKEPSPPMATGSDELLSVMIQRLRIVENQASVLQKELKEKSMKVIELEDKLRHEKLERRKSEDARVALVKEIGEMHQFLSDYGLKWVGDRSSQQSSRQQSPTTGAFSLYEGQFVPPQDRPLEPTEPSSATSQPRLPFDLSRLKTNAETLTAHVGFSGVHGDGAKRAIKEREMVYICVYQDGICVNSGPFRPYGWPLCDAIIDDILEGYYPYEFRERYPEGFPMTIVDQSNVKCPIEASAQPRSTGGAQITTLDSANAHGYKALTKDGFLKKLPEQYITSSGNIVNIRSGVDSFIGGTAAALVATSPLRTIAPSTSASTLLRDEPNSGNVTSVQVKLPSGQKVMLHMFFSNTIQDVRAELEKAVPAMTAGGSSYELCTIFPRRSYEDYAQTLQELGLVPNCTLMIKRIAPPGS